MTNNLSRTVDVHDLPDPSDQKVMILIEHYKKFCMPITIHNDGEVPVNIIRIPTFAEWLMWQETETLNEHLAHIGMQLEDLNTNQSIG